MTELGEEMPQAVLCRLLAPLRVRQANTTQAAQCSAGANRPHGLHCIQRRLEVYSG